MYNVTLRRVPVKIVAVENSNVTYSDCVFVTLGIQHAMRMDQIILSSVAFQVLQYFSTLSQNRHDFREKKRI
jgi:hypothetical protein